MNVLIISAHPDDESIGAGGTVLKHAAKEDDIFWIIVTDIFSDQGYSDKQISTRDKEINAVASKINAKQVFRLKYPTTTLSSVSVPALVTNISDIVKKTKPQIIYLPNRSDIHSDHRITFEAAMACTKSFRFSSVKTVLMYECLSETEFAPALPETVFLPNWFVDISEFLIEKAELVKVYKSEIHEHPFPRSLKNIKAIALHRGATAGYKYAEAFQLVRHIQD